MVSRKVPIEEVGQMLSMAFERQYTEAVKQLQEIARSHGPQYIFEAIEKEFLESNFTEQQ